MGNTRAPFAPVGPATVVLLLRELIEQAISDTDRAVVAEERDYVKAIRAAADPVRKLTIHAGAVRQIEARMAPLLLALRDASATEPEAEQVWREISDRRAANMRTLVQDLQSAGGLRAGLSVDEAETNRCLLRVPPQGLHLGFPRWPSPWADAGRLPCTPHPGRRRQWWQ